MKSSLKTKLTYLITFVVLLLTATTFTHLSAEQSNMSVSAVVPPTATDFQFAFNYEGSSLVHQDQTITYEITYGASESAGITLPHTIVVNYSSDKAPDKSYIVDYVFGSASKGYGGTQPVVDTKNRTITWHLSPLPHGTMNQKVNFQLHTNGNSHDLKRLSFTSTAAMSNEYVSMPTESVRQDYLFDPALVTPAPTATPDPRNIPTPTPIQSALQFLDISFSSISHSEANIAIFTNQPVRAYIRYGTSPSALSQRTQTTGFSTFNRIALQNLLPGTTYYFQVVATDRSGNTIASDILTFDSALTSAKILQGKDAYTITSGETVLLSNILEEGQDSSSFLLLPTHLDFKLTYTFDQLPSIESLEAIIRNDQGILQRVQMTALDARTYIAQLRTDTPGTYNIEVVQTDKNGNIMSRKISTLKVSSPISVLESDGFTPIADARIFLSQLNTATGKYEAVTDITNPRFTDKNGELTLLLLQGKYRIEVSAFGHTSRTVDFTIGPEEGSGYPSVTLDQDLFNINALLMYMKNQLLDSFASLLTTIKELSNSVRAFTSVAAVAVVSLGYLGFLLFHIRTDIRWNDILPFFLFHVAVLGKKHHEAYIFGTVLDKNNQPMNKVRLEFMHIKTDVVLAHALTNKAGAFRIPNTFKEPYLKLMAMKDGMPEVAQIVPTDIKKAVTVRIQKEKRLQFATVTAGIKHMAGEFFEVILLLNLIMELLFIDAFGVAKTLPFILLTFFNLALWIFYQKEHGLHRL